MEDTLKNTELMIDREQNEFRIRLNLLNPNIKNSHPLSKSQRKMLEEQLLNKFTYKYIKLANRMQIRQTHEENKADALIAFMGCLNAFNTQKPIQDKIKFKKTNSAKELNDLKLKTAFTSFLNTHLKFLSNEKAQKDIEDLQKFGQLENNSIDPIEDTSNNNHYRNIIEVMIDYKLVKYFPKPSVLAPLFEELEKTEINQTTIKFILISLIPKISMNDLTKLLKGETSWVIDEEFQKAKDIISLVPSLKIQKPLTDYIKHMKKIERINSFIDILIVSNSENKGLKKFYELYNKSQLDPSKKKKMRLKYHSKYKKFINIIENLEEQDEKTHKV